jgi:hypothetical protein
MHCAKPSARRTCTIGREADRTRGSRPLQARWSPRAGLTYLGSTPQAVWAQRERWGDWQNRVLPGLVALQL